MAAASLGFAIGLGRTIDRRTQVSVWFFCAAFLASGVAATAGGTYHGFPTFLESATRDKLWSLTMFAIGACGAFITAGIHAAYVRRKDGTVMWLAFAIGVTLAGAAVQQRLVFGTSAFNRGAAYHLIQLVGLYCLFRCAQTVHDRPAVEPAFSLDVPSALETDARQQGWRPSAL